MPEHNEPSRVTHDDFTIVQGLMAANPLGISFLAPSSLAELEHVSAKQYLEYPANSLDKRGSLQLLPSNNTWIESSEVTKRGLTKYDEKAERFNFIREYNNLAIKYGIRPIFPDAFRTSRDVRKNFSTKPGNWFSRKILRRQSATQNVKQKPERLLRHKRSYSDLSLRLNIKKDKLKDKDLEELVRLCGASLLYLPTEYSVGSLSLPTCFRATTQYLIQYGTTTKGLFRIPGLHSAVTELYNYYCYHDVREDAISGTVRCPTIPKHIKCDVYDVASALKKFLAGLPGGILGSLTLFDIFISIQSWSNGSSEHSQTKQAKIRARLIALAILSLDSEYQRDLICAIFGFLCMIGHIAETMCQDKDGVKSLPAPDMMNYSSLGVVFGPILAGDLLEDYTIKLANPKGNLVLLPMSPPKSRKERKKKHTPACGEWNMFNTRVDKIKIANGVTEMLIANWRDVVHQMRDLNLSRNICVQGIITRDPKQTDLRPSVSELFSSRKPPAWNESFVAQNESRSISYTSTRKHRQSAAYKPAHIQIMSGLLSAEKLEDVDLKIEKQSSTPRSLLIKCNIGAKSLSVMSSNPKEFSEKPRCSSTRVTVRKFDLSNSTPRPQSSPPEISTNNEIIPKNSLNSASSRIECNAKYQDESFTQPDYVESKIDNTQIISGNSRENPASTQKNQASSPSNRNEDQLQYSCSIDKAMMGTLEAPRLYYHSASKTSRARITPTKTSHHKSNQLRQNCLTENSLAYFNQSQCIPFNSLQSSYLDISSGIRRELESASVPNTTKMSSFCDEWKSMNSPKSSLEQSTNLEKGSKLSNKCSLMTISQRLELAPIKDIGDIFKLRFGDRGNKQHEIDREQSICHSLVSPLHAETTRRKFGLNHARNDDLNSSIATTQTEINRSKKMSDLLAIFSSDGSVNPLSSPARADSSSGSTHEHGSENPDDNFFSRNEKLLAAYTTNSISPTKIKKLIKPSCALNTVPITYSSNHHLHVKLRKSSRGSLAPKPEQHKLAESNFPLSPGPKSKKTKGISTILNIPNPYHLCRWTAKKSADEFDPFQRQLSQLPRPFSAPQKFQKQMKIDHSINKSRRDLIRIETDPDLKVPLTHLDVESSSSYRTPSRKINSGSPSSLQTFKNQFEPHSCEGCTMCHEPEALTGFMPPNLLFQEARSVYSPASLKTSSTPGRSNSVLYGRVRHLQRQLDLKCEEVYKLRQQLNIRQEIDIGTLSAQVQEMRKLVQFWQEKAMNLEKPFRSVDHLFPEKLSCEKLHHKFCSHSSLKSEPCQTVIDANTAKSLPAPLLSRTGSSQRLMFPNTSENNLKSQVSELRDLRLATTGSEYSMWLKYGSSIIGSGSYGQ
ncbi:Bgt-34 [Blumeria graminis f. sp. tritici]|uniref:Bgt-34 n=3 Tax=Blumeria graminis TaxID=34373 RepID=A0A061HFT7_BLUGR|nr:hypothetical protein BGT96224_34 [Blumeria graminis f. sp. tritici 96224]VDB94762.1 Bgt-34 [Blumeria graminis f. sp. tritici]